VFRLLGQQHIRQLLLIGGLVSVALCLILYPQEAVAAAKEGLTLCLEVIVPSLFPYFVLSSLVVDLGLAGYLGRALEGVTRRLFRVPGCCASAIVLGFVGGYPVGARTALDLYRQGQCSKVEAERLLSFCNNSGPAFILGVVGAGVFSSGKVGLLLYLAHALASICVGILFRFYGPREAEKAHPHAPIQVKRFTAAFTGAVTGAMTAAVNISAFVIFFSVIIRLCFLSGLLPGLAQLLGSVFGVFGLSPEWAKKLLTGLLELSSGVWGLGQTGSVAGRLSMAAFMLGWAGLSVHCQVLSFLSDSDLSPKTYLIGKLLHGGLSALFMAGLGAMGLFSAPVGVFLAQQVEGLAGLDFSKCLSISTATAWALWLAFFLLAVLAIKKSGNRRKHIV